MERKPYIVVTDAPYVAGQKVTRGQVLNLTADQAAYELSRKLLQPAPAAKAAAQQKRPRRQRG